MTVGRFGAAAMAALLFGCTPKEAPRPQVPPPVPAPLLAFTGIECESAGETGAPCALDFGTVAYGTSAKREFAVLNVSDKLLKVRIQARCRPEERSPAFEVLGEQYTVSLQPRETLRYTVVFAPLAPVAYQQSYRIATDDPSAPALDVDVAGTGAAPSVAVSPAQVDFGTVVSGVPHDRWITVSNLATPVGGVDLALRFATNYGRGEDGNLIFLFAPPTMKGDRELIVEWPPLGYDFREGVAPGSSVNLRIWFVPDGPWSRQATLQIYTNAPDMPVVSVPVTGRGAILPQCDFRLKPMGIDFGTWAVGSVGESGFELINPELGTQEICTVTSIRMAASEWSANAFELVDVPAGPVDIKRRESLNVRVRFAPRRVGYHESRVEITLAGADAPLAVPVTGSGVAWRLAAEPPVMDAGNAKVGCTQTVGTSVLINAGTEPFTILAMHVVEDEFGAFSPLDEEWFRSLAPGEQVLARVVFRPRAVQEASAKLRVAVWLAVGLREDVLLPLRGQGIPPDPMTDTFGGLPLPEMDILFVVDDAPFMADQQEALASGLAAMVRALFQDASEGWTKADINFAVTTTSVGEPGDANGRFLPLSGERPRVVNNRVTPNAEQVLLDNLNVGYAGNAVHQPLRAARLALSEPLLSTENAGFLRPGAHLIVFLVTAAKDEDSTAVAEYEEFFASLKAPAGGRASVWGLIPLKPTAPGPEADCAYASEDAGRSQRLRDIISRTGGDYQDICAESWQPFPLLPPCIENLHRLRLSQRPVDPAEIRVSVNGTSIPQEGEGGEKAWSYDASANAIEWSTHPDCDATISVTYPSCTLP